MKATPYTLLLLFMAISTLTQAQKDYQSAIRNFSIMVIPFFENEEGLDAALDKKPEMRSGIAIMQEKFIAQNLKVIDFEGKYHKFKQDQVMLKMEDSKSQFLKYAAPDIYAELDIQEVSCPGYEHRMQVSLKTYFTNSGELLATKVEKSNCFQKTVDNVSLIGNAANFFLESYVKELQANLQLLAEAGQQLELRIEFDENAKFNANSMATAIINGNTSNGTMVELLAEWFEAKTDLVRSFISGGNSEQAIIYPEVRIPLINPTTQRIYPPDNFTKTLRQFLESIELPNGATVMKPRVKIDRIGGALYLTIS